MSHLFRLVSQTVWVSQLEFMKIMFMSHDGRICHIWVSESESLGQLACIKIMCMSQDGRICHI
jgi:hypothetical protein